MADKKEIPTEVVDATEAMRTRCRPVVRRLLQDMLDNNLLLADATYIEQQTKAVMGTIVHNVIADHYNEVVATVHESLGHMLKDAQDIVWGKDADSLNFDDIHALFEAKRKKDKKALKEEKK